MMASEGFGRLMTYHYLLHGLSVVSDIEFPELADTAPGPADVVINVAPAAGSVEMATNIFADNEAAFTIPGVGVFAVHGGSTIIVRPYAGADERDLRLYILGSAMGILLHQRGLFALHAAAFVSDNRAVAITGASGAGKSTLALALQAAGLPLLSDDLIAVEMEGDRAQVSRAARRMRLFPESLSALGVRPDSYPLSYSAGDRIKHDVPIDHAPETAELAAIVELADGPPGLFLLEGADAVNCLMANSFRGSLLAGSRQRSDHFETCIKLAGRVPTYRLTRPRDFDGIADQVAAVSALAATPD